MAPSQWPLADLWLQTPELELRWPSPAGLDALAVLAAAGVHDPEVQPFMVAWTGASPEERARSTLQYHWSRWGYGKPSDWMLEIAPASPGMCYVTRRMVTRNGVLYFPNDAEGIWFKFIVAKVPS